MQDFDQGKPFISIVIPCRNESKNIADCLDSIFLNDYPKGRFEVLVVDGLSTDDTRQIIQRYIENNHSIRLLDNLGKTTPKAFNIGIRNAGGEYILIMSAHSTYPASYISDTFKLFSNSKVGNAGGRFVNIPNGGGPWATPIAVVTGHLFGVGNGAFRTSSDAPRYVDTVAFGFYKKSVFNEIGLFDERLTRNQDNEFNDRLRRAGYKIILNPAIKIYYKNQSKLSGLARQGFNTGVWNVYTLTLFPYSFKSRRFVPALFVAYLISIPFLLSFNNLYLLPAVFYLLLNLFFSLTCKCPLMVKIRISVTFLFYHLAYGAGALLGGLKVITGKWKSDLGKPLIG